jgi:hypothetical protein
MSLPVTAHFNIEEFACHDGTPYPISQSDDEDSLGRPWITTRLTPLCNTLEVIRDAAGGESITVDSGYRTLAYDEKIYEASAKDGSVAPASASQHPKGRAADIVHASKGPVEMFNLILQLYADGKLPQLGGVGLYPNFVHVDVRRRPGSTGGANDGHLAIWGGTRPSNVA